MAERSVVVKLRADVDQFIAGTKQAKDSMSTFGREVSGRGKTARADVEAVGRAGLIAGAAMAAGLGKAILTAADFEKEMSGVRAVSGATATEMDRLSQAAIDAGASQQLAGVTASDAARAEAELVKAGVSVSDVLGGALMGSLTLASAGQLDFADAATIAAQAMNIFDLRGSQVTHVADVLAAAANKSAADVGQLGDAMRQGGLVAAQTGLSMEETVAALAAFADNALIGSDAGTSLKTMLQRLTPISKEAAGLMDELGFSAYDAQGNFIGLEGLAQELQTSLGDMTVEQRNLAMATLFGSDAVRAANILYAEGAEGIREYEEAVNDQGAAARMAAIQNDNLRGDIEALGGAIESAFIENGSKATGILRGITQAATGAVNGFSSMPEIVQTSAFALGGVVTAGTLTIGVLGTIYPKAVQAKQALEGMGSTGQFLARNLKGIAGGLGAIGAGLAVFGTWQAVMGQARSEAEKWMATWRADALGSATDGLDAFKDKLSEVNFQWGELSDDANRSKAPWDADKREQLRAGADELEAIGDEMMRVADLSDDLARSLKISGDDALQFVLDQQSAGVDILAEDYDTVAGALRQTFQQMTNGTVASQQLGGAMDTLGSDIASVEDQVKAFQDGLDALFDMMFGVESAADALQSGLNELPDVLKSAKEEGLDLNDALTDQSDAAISLRDQMRGMVSDASDLIAEWNEQGVTGQELQNRIDFLSGSFRAQAEAAGVPGPVVEHYLGLLGQIPISKNTAVTANIGPAMVELDRLARRLNDMPGNLRFSVGGGGGLTLASGGLVPQYLASGGFQPRGTDTVPAMLTPGEYVVRAPMVDRFGVGFMDAINRGIMPATGFGGGSSYDQSRHVTFAPQQTIVTADPRRAAVDSVFELKVMAAGMAS